MGKKLIVFDVDGTLIDAENLLPTSAAQAIQALKCRGYTTAFFTGRPYTHVPPAVRELPFDACICTMGAYVRLDGGVVQDLLPDPEVVRSLVTLIRECDLDAVFESDEGISFDETRPLSPFLQKLKENFSARGFETGRGIDRKAFSFAKLCVWAHEGSDTDRFQREAERHLKVIGKKQNMMELVSREASTEGAMRLLLEHYGIAKENCFAIGDSVNDLPMLRCAGHSAAMGGAADEMKAQVEFVTSAIHEDGLLRFLQHYELVS